MVAPAPANGIEVIGSGSESRLHIGRLRQALHAGDWICSGIVTSPPVGELVPTTKRPTKAQSLGQFSTFASRSGSPQATSSLPLAMHHNTNGNS